MKAQLVTLLACLLACQLACLLARSLTCLLRFVLLCLLDLPCFALFTAWLCFGLLALLGFASWTPGIQPNDALRPPLVEYLVFNLLALAWLELARICDFAWSPCVGCFGLIWSLSLLLLFFACFAVFSLLASLCCACLVTIALQWHAMLNLVGFNLARLGLSPLALVWLGRLASWHALDFKQKNSSNLSKTAPILARFEVDHDFLKHTYLV